MDKHRSTGRRTRRRLATAVLAVALAVPGVLSGIASGGAADRSQEPQGSGVLDGTAAIAAEQMAPSKTTGQIGEAIEALVGNEAGVFGIVLMQPNGKVLYSRNARTPFVSASLYKVILIAEICAAIDSGLLSIETPLDLSVDLFRDPDGWDAYYHIGQVGSVTTVGEALHAAGAFSSNVAAMALFSLTSPAELNGLAARLGLEGTFLLTDPRVTPVWPPKASNDAPAGDVLRAERLVLSYATDGRVNMTNPFDMARFFMLLVNGRVVNERVSGMLMEILSQSTINDRIPALLPPGTRVAHKTGNLPKVVHDVGIIWAPTGPVVLAAMVEDTPSQERAIQIVQRLALIAYGIYDIPPVTAPEASPAATPAALDGTWVLSGRAASGDQANT